MCQLLFFTLPPSDTSYDPTQIASSGIRMILQSPENPEAHTPWWLTNKLLKSELISSPKPHAILSAMM
jgi:hypothetical protein